MTHTSQTEWLRSLRPHTRPRDALHAPRACSPVSAASTPQPPASSCRMHVGPSHSRGGRRSGICGRGPGRCCPGQAPQIVVPERRFAGVRVDVGLDVDRLDNSELMAATVARGGPIGRLQLVVTEPLPPAVSHGVDRTCRSARASPSRQVRPSSRPDRGSIAVDGHIRPVPARGGPHRLPGRLDAVATRVAPTATEGPGQTGKRSEK